MYRSLSRLILLALGPCNTRARRRSHNKKKKIRKKNQWLLGGGGSVDNKVSYLKRMTFFFSFFLSTFGHVDFPSADQPKTDWPKSFRYYYQTGRRYTPHDPSGLGHTQILIVILPKYPFFDFEPFVTIVDGALDSIIFFV